MEEFKPEMNTVAQPEIPFIQNIDSEVIFSNSVQSLNYIRDNNGWALKEDGTIEANDIDLRGKMKAYTSFEGSSRFTTVLVNGGTVNFADNGAAVASSATQQSSAKLSWALTGSASLNIFDSDPVFSIMVYAYALDAANGSGSAFFGFGNVTVNGDGHTFDENCAGFYITKSSGIVSLYAIQSNTTSSTQSPVLTTIASDDVLDLIIKVKSDNRFIYYWRKNAGTLSASTEIKSSLPASNPGFQFSVSNNNTNKNMTFVCCAASYER